MNQDHEFYQRRFSEIFDLIEQLRVKVFATEGFIFKKHRHSKDQLFHDPMLYKLSARFGTLEYNIRSWERFDVADKGLLEFCDQNLSRVEKEIDQLISDIENRKPTGWERVREFLWGVIKVVFGRISAEILPLLGRPTGL